MPLNVELVEVMFPKSVNMPPPLPAVEVLPVMAMAVRTIELSFQIPAPNSEVAPEI